MMEGKLSASEAALVRAELAASDPEVVEAFADAAAVAGELDLVKNTGTAPPTGRVRGIFGWSALGVLAAAALVFVVVRVTSRGNQAFSANDIIASLPATVGAPSVDPWPAVRGGTDDLAAPVRGARLGVLMVDFQLAARAGDTLSVRRKAAAIAALGGELAGAAPLVAQFRAIASGDSLSPPSSTAPDPLVDALAALAQSESLTAAAEAEVVRAAAESRDPEALTAVCARSALVARKLSLELTRPAESIRDSLTASLAERPCQREILAALSSALLAAITR